MEWEGRDARNDNGGKCRRARTLEVSKSRLGRKAARDRTLEQTPAKARSRSPTCPSSPDPNPTLGAIRAWEVQTKACWDAESCQQEPPKSGDLRKAPKATRSQRQSARGVRRAPNNGNQLPGEFRARGGEQTASLTITKSPSTTPATQREELRERPEARLRPQHRRRKTIGNLTRGRLKQPRKTKLKGLFARRRSTQGNC